MTNSFSGARTKIKWRGDMLVAWFAEATPPVLWRWQPGDISSGFGLKKEDGRTELVKHEAATGSTVVAAFSSEARAQNALAELSGAMMDGGSGGFSGFGQQRSWPATIWKWLSRIVLTLLLLYFTYGLTRILSFLNDPVGNVMQQVNCGERPIAGCGAGVHHPTGRAAGSATGSGTVASLGSTRGTGAVQRARQTCRRRRLVPLIAGRIPHGHSQEISSRFKGLHARYAHALCACAGSRRRPDNRNDDPGN